MLVATSLTRLYISSRQLAKYKLRSMDMYISEFFEQPEFESSQAYNQEKHTFGMFSAVFNLTLEFAIWYFFVPAWLWNRVDSFMAQTNLCLAIPFRNDILQAFLFILMWTLFNMVIALPFTLYKTFVIEERWGYNKTTAGTFACD